MSKETITNIFEEDWGMSSQFKVCNKIFEYLLYDQSANHITYGLLQSITGNQFSKPYILEAVQYLCGARVHLLEAKFEFIENGEVYPLSNAALKSAEESGELVHPYTGELITNYKEKVFVYFEPSNVLQDIDR